MAALFVPAFLMQQYFRFLSFSRGRPNAALAQTLAVLVSAVLLRCMAKRAPPASL